LPASAPERSTPLTVTVLPAPTFLLSKLAVPPASVTTSPVILPTRLLVAIVAEALPSYTLSAAVKLPVRASA
jgi:hypothetical protein